MKISIITATYNSGATLRDTLQSVFNQDYTDYELIIQDGGSTDNTKEIVRKLKTDYQCIELEDWDECKEELDYICKKV